MDALRKYMNNPADLYFVNNLTATGAITLT